MMARLKVSNVAVHGPLKHFIEGGSVGSKCMIRQTQSDQLIRQSLHWIRSLRDRKATLSQMCCLFRFSANVRSPCDLECMLSLKQKEDIPNTKIFRNSSAFLFAFEMNAGWNYLD